MILLPVVGFVLIYAATMALFLTEEDGNAGRESPTWKLWVDLVIPIFSTPHSLRNFRRNWWTMRGPSVVALVGVGLLLLALLLWKCT